MSENSAFLLNGGRRSFIIYYDILDLVNALRVRNSMLQTRKRAPAKSQFTQEEREYRISVLMKLEKLEREILTLKGEERNRAIEAYRELLWVLENVPIYLTRY